MRQKQLFTLAMAGFLASLNFNLLRRGKMKRLRFVVWVVALSLALGGTPFLVPEDVAAEGLRANKRVDVRQDRRGDRPANASDGVEDRQDFREGRRDSIGKGPEDRIDNRQDKRDDRRDRTGDRMEDRGKRLDKRFD